MVTVVRLDRIGSSRVMKRFSRRRKTSRRGLPREQGIWIKRQTSGATSRHIKDELNVVARR